MQFKIQNSKFKIEIFNFDKPKEFKRAMALPLLSFNSGTVDEPSCPKKNCRLAKIKCHNEYHFIENNPIFVTKKSRTF